MSQFREGFKNTIKFDTFYYKWSKRFEGVQQNPQISISLLYLKNQLFNINIELQMNNLYHFLFGDNSANYVEVGFSEEQAKAMSWIAEQKPKGKFMGLIAGSFLAYSWGHWHDRVLSYFRFSFSRRYTQLSIVASAITFGDYLLVGNRKGADQIIPNMLYLNNNLFRKNMQSLVDNFNVLNRKFTSQEILLFNERGIAVRSNVDLKDRKWIFNPELYTREQFERKVRLLTNAPWNDQHIANTIKYEHLSRQTKELRLAPTKLDTLIDNQGDKLGITTTASTFWTPLK